MRCHFRNPRLLLSVACLSVVVFICRLEVDGHPDHCLASAVNRAAAPHVHTDDPWKADELIEPADLIRLLSSDEKPLVLQIGILHLYKIGHIPGSIYAGTASTAEGLATLKKAVQDVPRDREVVFYCGCCPFPDCPNIRPAYQALRELGFKRIKLLNLPHNFIQDWQSKGLPVEKSNS